MPANRRWTVFGGGLALGILVGFLFGGSQVAPAHAQPPGPPAVVGRYQISSFDYGYSRANGAAQGG
jgi:hypothetical protein